MDELFGIPAHPLIVHAPVVLLPLAVVGVVAMLLRPTWYLHFRWPVLAITAVGTLGAIFAASSGEELEELVEDSKSGAAREAIEEHAEAGEMARTLAIVFLVAVVAFVVIPWFLERRARATAAAGSTDVATAPRSAGPTWLKPVLMVVVALAAVGSLVTIIDAGHSGAGSVWDEIGVTSGGGGDDDDGD
jgi:uncharacterized membrane protein YgcG